MLNHVPEVFGFVLLLPVAMNIVLPLGMLAGWLVWRGINVFIGERRSRPRSVIRYAS